MDDAQWSRMACTTGVASNNTAPPGLEAWLLLINR